MCEVFSTCHDVAEEQSMLDAKLQETGEKERLKECPWRALLALWVSFGPLVLFLCLACLDTQCVFVPLRSLSLCAGEWV